MPTSLLRLSLLTLLVAAAASGPLPAQDAAPVPDFPRVSPTEPAESVATFRTLGGFRMELVAAEPLVADPVDLAYDPSGRAWVVEFRGYPKPEMPADPTPAPIGRVRLLEDTDGDGEFDRSDVFVDDLQWPTSVVLWRRGIFVAAPPDIWYFEDVDGDRQADVRRKVFTGFGTHNIQAVMNNLRWGLDGWIYGAAAGNGGEVRPADRPDAPPVMLKRRDFRFDPETGVFEATSGGERFGSGFDDWGNRFLCNIRNPVQHVVLPSRYLARNRHLVLPSAIHDVAESGDTLPVFRISPPEPWRIFRAQRWAKERVNYPRSELVGAGYFTSSSGVAIYRGGAYPTVYAGNAFVADVAANVIHRQVLEPDGSTFRGRRGDADAEFVASTDPWFRPVNFVNAPDGTLTVVDMYRETIEHPWSIPDDIRAKLDLSSGNDRGRLYRLAPPGFRPPTPPRLGDATTTELVAELESPHAWRRETAQRLLRERDDAGAVEPLRRLLRSSRVPQTRLHALWSLERLAVLTEADLLATLADRQPQVRAQAVLVAEPRLTESPPLTHAVVTAAADDDPRVRMQVALSLGGLTAGGEADPPTLDALAAIARRDAGDRWARAAVLTSAGDVSAELLARVVSRPFADPVSGIEVVRQLAYFAGARGDADAAAVLEVVKSLPTERDDDRYAAVGGLADGLLRRRKCLADLGADQLLTDLLDRAAAVAADPDAPLSRRVAATDLLRHGPLERMQEVVPALLGPQQPRDVHLAAVRTLGAFADPAAAGLLLDQWRRLTPPVRAEAVEVLLRRPTSLGPFLAAMEEGRVEPADVPIVRRNLLVLHADPAIKARATKLFGADAPGPRGDAITSLKSSLTLVGDVAEGRLVFRRECAACHRAAGEGQDVGPALTTVRHRSPEEILIHVLDPNREVSPDWVEYVVATHDGRVLTGTIASETEAGLTLRRAGGAQDSVARSDVAELSATGKSLMPEGFEKKIGPQEMADLIAFLLDGSAAAPTESEAGGR